jgi:hypothetical protein
MSVVESPPKIEIDQLLAKANQKLRRELQIQPDDPVLSLLALNDELFKAYSEMIKQAIKEAQHEIDAKTQQDLEIATERAAKMIANTGDILEKQLVNAGLTWEQKFKESAAIELAKVQAASQVAKFGGYCLMAAGVLALAYALIQLVARLTGQHP